MKGTSPSRGCGEVTASGIKSAMMERAVFINRQEGKAMNIITVGIDLAKNVFAVVFAVHGVNENDKAEWVKPKISRDQLLPLMTIA